MKQKWSSFFSINSNIVPSKNSQMSMLPVQSVQQTTLHVRNYLVCQCSILSTIVLVSRAKTCDLLCTNVVRNLSNKICLSHLLFRLLITTATLSGSSFKLCLVRSPIFHFLSHHLVVVIKLLFFLSFCIANNHGIDGVLLFNQSFPVRESSFEFTCSHISSSVHLLY